MPRVRFSGRVVPAKIPLTLNGIPSVTFKSKALTMVIQPIVANNVVTVDCDVEPFIIDNITRIFSRAYEITLAAIDLAGFIDGHGFAVVWETFTDHNGATSPLLFTDKVLAPLVTAATVNTPSYLELWNIVSISPALHRILRDLVETVEKPLITPINCARAIEGIRNLIAPEKERPVAWKIFDETLRVDRKYRQFITDNSTAQRHGDVSVHIPPGVTREIGIRSWKIANRYLELRKRGGHGPLSLAKFPLLTG